MNDTRSTLPPADSRPRLACVGRHGTPASNDARTGIPCDRKVTQASSITQATRAIDEAVWMLQSLEAMRPDLETNGDLEAFHHYSIVYGFIAMRIGKSLDNTSHALGGSHSGWFDSLRNPPRLATDREQEPGDDNA